jgi:heme exporter protein C
MNTIDSVQRPVQVLAYVIGTTLLLSVMLIIAMCAPAEATMGDGYRIVYLHVPVAWLGLFGFLVMAGCGVGYLLSRDLRWDHWAHSAAELGWLCCGLTLATGSLWARAAWGAWWIWEPRLTTCFVLWLIYAGCLVIRSSLTDMHQCARLGSVFAIVGAIDIPLVVMATRWFRGMHPVSPEMEGSMRTVLAWNIALFTLWFAVLLWQRRNQLQWESALRSASV